MFEEWESSAEAIRVAAMARRSMSFQIRTEVWKVELVIITCARFQATPTSFGSSHRQPRHTPPEQCGTKIWAHIQKKHIDTGITS